jgi:hypothetical protein
LKRKIKDSGREKKPFGQKKRRQELNYFMKFTNKEQRMLNLKVIIKFILLNKRKIRMML